VAHPPDAVPAHAPIHVVSMSGPPSPLYTPLKYRPFGTKSIFRPLSLGALCLCASLAFASAARGHIFRRTRGPFPGGTSCKPCAHKPAAQTIFILWDTEHTSWEGSNARGWRGFIPGTRRREARELIQVSAMRVIWDTSRKQLTAADSMRLFVRPAINPKLSSYVLQLTNISQAEVDGGSELSAAVDELLQFAAKGRPTGERESCTPMFSWGNDWNVVSANLALRNLTLARKWDAWPACMHDVKPTFRAAGVNVSNYSSGTVHQAAGIPTAGHVHDSGWDCTSMRLGLQALLPKHPAVEQCLGHSVCTAWHAAPHESSS
jgi:hypothetical protein